MATEYKLSYTATEIDEKLGMVDNMVKSVNGVVPDENGNVDILGTITGIGEPTTETKGAVGNLYMDTDTGDLYKCTVADEGAYKWVVFSQESGDSWVSVGTLQPGLVERSTGETVANTEGAFSTRVVEVEKGAKYRITILTASYYHQAVFKDENGNFLSYIPCSNPTAYSGSYYAYVEHEIQVPENAHIMLVSSRTVPTGDDMNVYVTEPIVEKYIVSETLATLSDKVSAMQKRLSNINSAKDIGRKIASGEIKKILLLGDSITDGYGGTGYNGAGYTGSSDQELSTNTAGYCWANAFKKFVESTYGATVENCGAYGSVLATQKIVFAEKVESGNYDLIIFLTGTNNRNEESLFGNYKADIASTIEWMKEYAEVFVMNNIPARSDDDEAKPHSMDEIASVIVGVSDVPDYYENLYSRFVEYCEVRDISLANDSSVFLDAVHPNDTGYHIMFKLICSAIGIPLSAHVDYTASGSWWTSAET